MISVAGNGHLTKLRNENEPLPHLGQGVAKVNTTAFAVKKISIIDVLTT